MLSMAVDVVQRRERVSLTQGEAAASDLAETSPFGIAVTNDPNRQHTTDVEYDEQNEEVLRGTREIAPWTFYLSSSNH
jgi:hypothetical protein